MHLKDAFGGKFKAVFGCVREQYMDVADALLGKVIVVCTFVVFGVFVLWISGVPFIEVEEGHWIAGLFPYSQYILLSCGIWGLFFIGTLMVFTYYHIKPHLHAQRTHNYIEDTRNHKE